MGDNAPYKTMRILNRIVTLTPNGLTYEADPRHGELLVRNCWGDATTQAAKDHETMVITPRSELGSDNNTGDDDSTTGTTEGTTTAVTAINTRATGCRHSEQLRTRNGSHNTTAMGHDALFKDYHTISSVCMCNVRAAGALDAVPVRADKRAHGFVPCANELSALKTHNGQAMSPQFVEDLVVRNQSLQSAAAVPLVDPKPETWALVQTSSFN